MKTAIVTGGTRGIGAAISLRLQTAGYHVIAGCRHDSDANHRFAAQSGIEVYPWDVSDFQASQNAMHDIIGRFGAPAVLVHNAGITADGFFHKMSKRMWDDVIRTDLDSCFNVLQPAVIAMRREKYGRIVVLSSVNAITGQPGQTNYCAAKAGVIGFVKALAMENAGLGITVNAVAPGYTDTEMVRDIDPMILNKIISRIPAGRLADPREIAALVEFLAGEHAGYITGTVHCAAGGLA